MWISLFCVACGFAVCLSVAAVMMQPVAQRTLRG
jgi:H+/gluconate symporter-like permease